MIRSGAWAFVAVLLFAAPSRAEVGLLSPEPLPSLVEVDASWSTGADAATTAVTAEAEPTPATMSVVREEIAADPHPEISAAEAAIPPVINQAEAAVAPELVIDLGDTDTMSLIAASLAEVGAASTGSIRAAEPQAPAGGDEVASLEGEVVSLETEVSRGEAAEAPILP